MLSNSQNRYFELPKWPPLKMVLHCGGKMATGHCLSARTVPDSMPRRGKLGRERGERERGQPASSICDETFSPSLPSVVQLKQHSLLLPVAKQSEREGERGARGHKFKIIVCRPDRTWSAAVASSALYVTDLGGRRLEERASEPRQRKSRYFISLEKFLQHPASSLPCMGPATVADRPHRHNHACADGKVFLCMHARVRKSACFLRVMAAKANGW